MQKYWLWLTTRKGLSARDAGIVVRHFQTPEAAYFAVEEQYRNIAHLRSWKPLLDKDLSEPEAILETCRAKGYRIITMQDAAYPKRLKNLDDAPLVLYCRGSMPDLNKPAVAVIGTRKASIYGLSQARRFAYGLARCGCIVVSGGAKGVDTEAIRGALLGGGPVVAVIGSGLDVDYPPSNRKLFEQVAQNGCILSEFVPGTPPYAANFPVRNRIISGLSLGVLVTEAPARSGALITASRALDQGRDVFVLPANVGVDTYAGNLKLLRDGAIPAGEVWDILQEYQPQYPSILKKSDVSLPEEMVSEQPQEDPVRQQPAKKVIDKPKSKDYIDVMEHIDSLSEEEKRLLLLLREGAMHIDALVEKTGAAAGSVLAVLTMLEVKGLVVRLSARSFELAEK